MMFIVCGFGIIALFFICYSIHSWILDVRTKKLLKIHQEEWNKINAELEEKGADFREILDAYCHFLDVLISTRDALCGACFPSFNEE